MRAHVFGVHCTTTDTNRPWNGGDATTKITKNEMFLVFVREMTVVTTILWLFLVVVSVELMYDCQHRQT